MKNSFAILILNCLVIPVLGQASDLPNCKGSKAVPVPSALVGTYIDRATGTKFVIGDDGITDVIGGNFDPIQGDLDCIKRSGK